MNTSIVKEVSRKVMLVSGCTFTAGFGAYCIADCFDKSEIKATRKQEKHEASLAASKEIAKARAEQIRECAEREKILKKRISEMSDKEFAKYYAKEQATASEEAIAKAKAIKLEAEMISARAKEECSEKLRKMEIECSEKVTKANELYLKAKTDYEKIKSEFDDREEVLEARKKLDALIKKENEQKKSVEDLKKEIAELLE